MNDQEREHWDHEEGCQTELQNAFALSKMTVQIKNELDEATDLVNQGKHVLMYSRSVLCPSTDAYIGREVIMISSFETRELAIDALRKCDCEDDHEADYWVLPMPKIEPVKPDPEIWFEGLDIPF